MHNLFLTGSFPDRDDPLVDPPPSPRKIPGLIRRAVRLQIKAGLDVIVDGQMRSDIVGIFARQVGLEGNGLPYRVRAKIGRLQKSITLSDIRIAATAASGHPIKAHITGPTVISESCVEDDGTPDFYRQSVGFRQLTLDIATALGDEARFLAEQSQELNIQYLQIDEPSLVYGADLGLARDAIGVVAQSWRAGGGGEVILHVCGDIRDILSDLIAMPVDILNLENVHLREADENALQLLRGSDKKLALGVIRVNTDKIPTPQHVAQEMLFASDRYGAERLWGITPNCGLRLSTTNLAVQRMKSLVESTQVLSGRSGRKV